jgi:hypothetical protein
VAEPSLCSSEVFTAWPDREASQVSSIPRPGPAPGHSRVTDSRHQAALKGHGRTRRSGNLSSGGPLRSRRDTRGHSTKTVRDREAKNGVMTAKMTANMADGGGRPWTVTESPRLRSNAAGPSWTCADARLAVFKTVWGSSVEFHPRSRSSANVRSIGWVTANDSQVHPSPQA